MAGGTLYMGLANATSSEDYRGQKKRRPEDEIADARYRDAMALKRAEMAQQGRQFDEGLAAQREGRQQAGIQGIAAGGGSMSGAAGKYLLNQAAGQGGGETYADRLARVNAAYADKVQRSNEMMRQGQAKQNALDSARMAASPTDLRRMTFQAPGEAVRELLGQDTQLLAPQGRTPETHSQMEGLQGELAQRYPNRAPVDPAIEQRRRYEAQRALQDSTRPLGGTGLGMQPADWAEIGMRDPNAPNMPGGPGTPAAAPQPALNITGMAEYQRAMRGEAFGAQGDNPEAGQHGQAAPVGSRRELSPQEYSQVEQSFSANAPVRMPYTEGPGTAQGPGAPISQSKETARLKLEAVANRASGPGQDAIGTRIATLDAPDVARNQRIARLSASQDPKVLAEAQKLRAEKEKEAYQLQVELEKTFPDVEDRRAYLEGKGLTKFLGRLGQPAPAAGTQTPRAMPSRMPTASATGPNANTTVLPVSRFNEGMAARTIDAGAPQSPDQMRAARLAELQAQGQQAQTAGTQAADWLKANPAPTPGSQFREDPVYAARQRAELDVLVSRARGENAKAGIYESRDTSTPEQMTAAGEVAKSIAWPEQSMFEAQGERGKALTSTADQILAAVSTGDPGLNRAAANRISLSPKYQAAARLVQGRDTNNKRLFASAMDDLGLGTTFRTLIADVLQDGFSVGPDRRARIDQMVADARRMISAVNAAKAVPTRQEPATPVATR